MFCSESGYEIARNEGDCFAGSDAVEIPLKEED